MSLDSLKTFLTTKTENNTPDFGAVDPYNTFTFKFIKSGKYNLGNNLYGNDIHKYIKQVTLPNASINGEQINIPGIQFATSRLMPMGDSGSTIRVEFLNTVNPILEGILFEWMKKYTLEADDYPANFKANIEIGFTHSSMNRKGESDKVDFSSSIDKYKYMYYGVRPVEMGTYNPSNEPMTEFYRNVTFTYDYFWIDKASNIEYAKYTAEQKEFQAKRGTSEGYAGNPYR